MTDLWLHVAWAAEHARRVGATGFVLTVQVHPTGSVERAVEYEGTTGRYSGARGHQKVR